MFLYLLRYHLLYSRYKKSLRWNITRAAKFDNIYFLLSKRRYKSFQIYKYNLLMCLFFLSMLKPTQLAS